VLDIVFPAAGVRTEARAMAAATAAAARVMAAAAKTAKAA
jgi:hypothetical protein